MKHPRYGAPRDTGDVDPLGRRVARRLWLSALLLRWEGLWPALWPLLAILAAFAAITLFGIWQAAPLPLHAALLAAFASAFAVGLWHAARAPRRPARSDAVRRLERESGVRHRPLSSLLDTPALAPGDRQGRFLWEAHRQRMARLLPLLRVAPPQPLLTLRDPLALRALLVLTLAVAGAFAGNRADDYFAAALAFDKSQPAPPGRLTAWIDPPAYTGLPPIFLTPPGGADPTAPVPAGAHESVTGSILSARVFGGGAEAPVLGANAAPFSFQPEGDGNFTLEHVLSPAASGGSLTIDITQGERTLGAWEVALIDDAPPSVALAEQPVATRRGVLRLSYMAEDDFGLDAVEVAIRRAEIQDDAWPINFSLPLPGLQPVTAEESSYHDLTAHPWAGLPVMMNLTARDNAGQYGPAPEFGMVLPQRPFIHPVAIEIIDLRRNLALDHAAAGQVRAGLQELLTAPEAFAGDIPAFLGLRAATTRLRLVSGEADIRSVVDLLWDVALRIEDGGLAVAEQELRAAQEALREALDNNTDPEELAELMDRLQEALDRYLEMLAESGREQEMLEDTEETALDPGTLRRSRDDLQRMIESARDLAETGARDSARDMLQQLQEFLENMEVGRPEQDPQTAGGERLLQQLQEIMEEQDALLEETFRRAQQGGEHERQSQSEEQTSADRQDSLRRALGEFMRQLGEAGAQIPDPLGRAEQSMRAARDDLEEGKPHRAAERQAEALADLQRGAEMVMNQMLAGQTGQRPGREGARRPEDIRDPLGRLPPGNDGSPEGYVELPDAAAVQRSREIRDELRRRSGERARSRDELNYIHRLLDMY